MFKFLKIFLSSILIICLFTTAVFGATVSSECDLTDINVPIDTRVENAAIGQILIDRAVCAVVC